MRLLLDTHIFLWFVSGDLRLSEEFRSAIIEPDNLVYLSVASVWEMMIKYGLGKLPLPESPDNYIPYQRDQHLIESLPITESSLKYLPTLPNLHRDPFDRCIISQALAGNLTIITVDDAITEYDVSVLS